MTKRGSHDNGSGNSNRKRNFLFWVLAVVILVALWYMFAGSVTLKWCTTNNGDFDSTIIQDLDVLVRTLQNAISFMSLTVKLIFI